MKRHDGNKEPINTHGGWRPGAGRKASPFPKFLKEFRATPEESMVLVPFAGTAPELIACENLSRRCRAIEISPAYVAVTLQRFYDHTDVMPKLVKNGNK